VVFCPGCNREWEEGLTECPVCGTELFNENGGTKDHWVQIGVIEDKLSADFAAEALKSYEIEAVIISKSGFFGDIGLTLNPFYSRKSPLFEISVRSDDVEEARGILDMVLGEKWHRLDTDT